MNRLLSISFITLTLVISAAGAAPAAHAQTATTSSATSVTTSAAVDNPTLANLEDNSGVFSKVMVFLMGIFAWLLGVAAITLDNTVYYTVITMGSPSPAAL